MRPIGFSTGAVARGDVSAGVEAVARCAGADAIELSALRIEELEPLVAAVSSLKLGGFRHVSVHAPSRFSDDEEARVVSLLSSLPESWPIVVHPDAIHRIDTWRMLEPRLLIENMDTRKRTGRTVDELQPFFAALPHARFCLDVAHARDVAGDGSGVEALLDAFRARLVQVHVSSIGRGGEHRPLDAKDGTELRELREQLPAEAALVIESVVERNGMPAELGRVQRALG